MKNRYRIHGDVTIIYIPYKDQMFETSISTTDLPRLLSNARHWNVKDYRDRSAGWRVLGRVVGDDGEVERTSLHRFIMKAPEALQVDHIDNNPLNNCRENLRLATPHQNQQNRAGAMRNSRSGVRGVSYGKMWSSKNACRYAWRAQIAFYGKQKHLGWFDSQVEAEEAVCQARAQYYEFSKEGMALAELQEAA